MIDEEKALESKWGKDGLCMGWTAFPTALIFLQSQLQLSSTDLNVIFNLLIHWWDADGKIYPSQDGIAKRMGVSKRTVQRTLDNLVELGLINVSHTKRKGKYKGRNIYDLKPLSFQIERLAPIVKEKMKEKQGDKDD
ncbi:MULTISPECIES: helix-turn-helix domain-containing protein [Halomonadaceae]|jgi:predicted transcriptional regulator|uniref:Helix-turn-helix domain-containing protein n=2 Tax=Vreelandella TaxID=3137766 RepID=A0A7Z0LXP5_9GAMM|nr:MULTISPECIES: helix-turn-helix domain-containing protein [Halomonas]EGP17896.1 hypothetical protein GME_19227 [Halomonas sp. TD01]NYS80496.1 helix-turn-helix domain-containing protein [Halomonas glaciei]WRK13129.1 hypothetical protein [Halomonas bluephagenesis]|tara:strand:- start:242 stop:652 length:411 start_codon:yes stop_codon:yes gene_type:complete